MYAAAARGLERAMNDAVGMSGGAASLPSAAAPAEASSVPRAHEGLVAPATPPVGAAKPQPARPARARTRHQPQATPPTPAPAPTNVVRVPAKRAPKPVVDKGPERRSPTQLQDTKAKLLEQIKETPGKTSEELVAALAAKGFETSTASLRLPLRALAQEAAIRHEGNKRYTRYFPASTPEVAKKPAKKTKAGKG